MLHIISRTDGVTLPPRLTARLQVRGVLEGIFAQGQLYVLVSRVTDCCWATTWMTVQPSMSSCAVTLTCVFFALHQDPRHFHLLGLPPIDLLEEAPASVTKCEPCSGL